VFHISILHCIFILCIIVTNLKPYGYKISINSLLYYYYYYWTQNSSDIGPIYCWAKTYADHVACCPLVSHGEYVGGRDGRTDGQTVTDARPLHYAFR